MKKYNFLYPAIFIKDEDDGSYQVIFPDLNIYTDGKNLPDAYRYANGLLETYFSYAVKYDVDYNLPSKVESLIEKCKKNEVVMLVEAFVVDKEN